MTDNHSFMPSSLANPEKRKELILYLEELAADDPEELWRNERKQGLVSDIDQIFHFFFDDNDFDEGAIGESLLDSKEAKAIDEVKALLNAMLVDYPTAMTQHSSAITYGHGYGLGRKRHTLLLKRGAKRPLSTPKPTLFAR